MVPAVACPSSPRAERARLWRNRLLAIAILAIAAFNLGFRINHEIVMEWDESLYATSAAEMVQSGNWVVTTFLNQTDYYNTKPPLNIWLIALSFKVFGTNLVSLRLATIVSSWLTIALLMWWTRRVWGTPVALVSALVLATSFGFLYVHSGRTANTDALFALLILLTVVTLWEAENKPWLHAALGPLLAGAFLLRGMAVLMPLSIVLAYALLSRRRWGWKTSAVAILLFAVPVSAWVFARWQVDQWQFLERLVGYDFLARSVSSLESHRTRGWLYYPYILVKHHYDWLFAALAALLLVGSRWKRLASRPGAETPAGMRRLTLLLGCWAGGTLIIPTLMRTKLPWYLNPFYPLFAIGIAWLMVRGWELAGGRQNARWRSVALTLVFVIALGVAEGKLIWYSFYNRSLTLSPQGLVLAERHRLRGHRVFYKRWNRADRFVVHAVARAEALRADTFDSFWRASRPGDYLLAMERVNHSELTLVRSQGSAWLYQRGDHPRRPSARGKR